MTEEYYLTQEILGGQRAIEHAAAFRGLLPSCVTNVKSDCSECPMQNELACPVKYSFDYHSYLKHLTSLYLDDQRKRRKRIDILVRILKEHKLPIHWEHLAILAINENSKIFTPNSVKGLVFFNPQIFHMVSEGVFELTEEFKET